MEQKINDLKDDTLQMKMDYDKRLNDYLIIVKSNEVAIGNLTKISEETSRQIQILAKSQQEILLNQKEMMVFAEQMENMDKRVTHLESNWGWTIKSVIGGVISILIGIILFNLKLKG